MEATIETVSGPIFVRTSIHPDFPSCDSVSISSGAFGFSIMYPRIRKELIAALLEADAELDAAAAERAASKKEDAA
jgi:hypothetical protein